MKLMHSRRVAICLPVLSFLFCAATAFAGRAEHVVIVIWDGMRPDAISEEDTPTLWKLRQQGVFFANNHSVYPASTEVNGTAIGTGMYPSHSGVIANNEYQPDADQYHPIGAESTYAIWKGDQLSGGQYIQAPTLAEILRKHGKTTAISGTKGVTLLLDRKPREQNERNSVIVFAGMARPSSLADELWSQFGPLPPLADAKRRANSRQDEWTTRVLTEKLWAKGVPALSMLWLSEPDFSQHGTGPGSTVVKKAIRSSDDDLARVLAALDEKKVRDKTDILVVSDHGFSTIGYTVDVVADLKLAGLNASASFSRKPREDDVIVVGNGGTVCLYVKGHDADVIQDAVAALQKTEYAGVIFTREPLPGTFTLAQANIDGKDAPDIVLAMHWWNDTSATGMPGMIAVEGLLVHGQGSHASLSPYELHNTLVAAGPDFRGGMKDTLPSGNIDVAPTALWILGIKDVKMDGRVLGEALVDGPAPADRPTTTVLEASNKIGDLKWRQQLKVTRLDGRTYLDEGNGKLTIDR